MPISGASPLLSAPPPLLLPASYSPSLFNARGILQRHPRDSMNRCRGVYARARVCVYCYGAAREWVLAMRSRPACAAARLRLINPPSSAPSPPARTPLSPAIRLMWEGPSRGGRLWPRFIVMDLFVIHARMKKKGAALPGAQCSRVPFRELTHVCAVRCPSWRFLFRLCLRGVDFPLPLSPR